MTEHRLRATAAVTALAMAAAAVLSACAASGSGCTDAPIYLLDNTAVAAISAGTRLDWDDHNGVVLTAHPLPTDLGDFSWATFAPVAGASDVVAFIAAPGAERTPGDWRQWGDASPIDTTGVLLPAVWPGRLGYGNPAEVRSAGGSYSMGIALTDGTAVDSAHVVKAYYTAITVDAGTGDWTFSDPAVCTAAGRTTHS